MEKILSISNLSVRYGLIKALFGINIELYENEIVAIVGANGAGKTTLLKAISGMVPLEAGNIFYKTQAIHSKASYEIARLGIAHVPEGRGIFTRITVEENLKVASLFLNKNKKTYNDLFHVYSLFPRLKERKNQLAGTLSGGEQQMLAIGRALMSSADVLLLDEPSMGLSPKLVGEIFDIIVKINKEGKSILLVEQNAMQALKISHRAYILENGNIRMSGKASDISSNPSIQEAYLGVKRK